MCSDLTVYHKGRGPTRNERKGNPQLWVRPLPDTPQEETSFLWLLPLVQPMTKRVQQRELRSLVLRALMREQGSLSLCILGVMLESGARTQVTS